MSKSVKPAFQSVELDLIDQRLESQAAEKGIPTLVDPKPEPPQPPPMDAALAAVRAIGKAPKPARQEKPAAATGTPRARMKALNIEVPDYAWIELKMRAAREMVSVRHVIMSALKASGIEIKEADMVEDGRRLRGNDTN